jgi:catechol 2,3-dioxygenase-like lactoylglutathione lyase family enzyme
MSESQTAGITGMHHSAYRCRDAAETRAFYEGVLGLEVAAALAFDTKPGTDEPLDYMHIFFALGDGNYVAFFDIPEGATDAHFALKSGWDLHFAFEATDRTALDDFHARLTDHGVRVFGPVDHGFITSIYAYDPNGIQIEITCRAADHDAILAGERAKADRAIDHWSDLKARRASASAAAE